MACKFIVLGLIVAGWSISWKVGETFWTQGTEQVITDGYIVVRERLPAFLIGCNRVYKECMTIISSSWVILQCIMEMYKYISELEMLSCAMCIFWIGLNVRRECQHTNELNNSVIIRVSYTYLLKTCINFTQFFLVY